MDDEIGLDAAGGPLDDNADKVLVVTTEIDVPAMLSMLVLDVEVTVAEAAVVFATLFPLSSVDVIVGPATVLNMGSLIAVVTVA